MISNILGALTSTPLASYIQLKRISMYSSYLSFLNISLFLQIISNIDNGGNRLFHEFLISTLPKSKTLINIISNNILKIPPKHLFHQILPNIFSKLIEKQDIKTIESISNFLNQSIYDISKKYLHKILPRILITIVDNNNNQKKKIIKCKKKN